MTFFLLPDNFLPLDPDSHPHLDPDPNLGRCGSSIRIRITSDEDPHHWFKCTERFSQFCHSGPFLIRSGSLKNLKITDSDLHTVQFSGSVPRIRFIFYSVYSSFYIITLSRRSLLLKLVEKSLSSKHPQLMLRRTESIVEKMLTNWLALCLYDYMKDYAGSSLFVLFKAIKFQVYPHTPSN